MWSETSAKLSNEKLAALLLQMAQSHWDDEKIVAVNVITSLCRCGMTTHSSTRYFG